MSIDALSKQTFIKLLKSLGFTEINDTDKTHDRFYYLDIEASKDGKKYAFELKNRSCTHNRYGDIMCEKLKADKAVVDINGGVYNEVYVCNMYADKTLAICDILTGREVVLYCPKSTSFGDEGYLYMSMWSLPQSTIYKFDNEFNFTKIK